VTALRLAVSIHDVAPATWRQCADLLGLVARADCGPCTLLVVPDYHRSGRCDLDRDFVRAVTRRLHRGDDIALHGYFHWDDAPAPLTLRGWISRRVLTAHEGEFAALGRDQAAARLERGQRLFQSLGWPTRGFVPPAWLLGPGQAELLRDAGFEWTSTRDSIINLADGSRRPAPSLTCSVRSPLRRWASRSWLSVGQRLYGSHRLLRVALHPSDARHARIMEDWLRLLLGLRRSRLPVLEGPWRRN
jgi:predicted deacetylase